MEEIQKKIKVFKQFENKSIQTIGEMINIKTNSFNEKSSSFALANQLLDFLQIDKEFLKTNNVLIKSVRLNEKMKN